MNKKLFSFLYLGIFVGIVGLFFYPTILRGKLPVPSDALVGLYHPWRDLYAKEHPRGIPFKNFLITDPVRQQIPWRKIAIDQWKEGKIPKWNPYNVSGTPLTANIQAAVFYPFNILFFFFDFPVAWTILIILEPLLAGIFLFLYLRNLGLDPLACLLGSLVWSFSGYSIAWLTWGTMVHVALWLPIVLLAVDRLIKGKTFRQNIIWSLILVLGLSMQIFAGHIQIALYTISVSLFYNIWRIVGEKEHTKKVVPYLTGGIILFLFITSIQWIPLFQFIVETGRIGEVDSWLKGGWLIPWQHLVQFLAPDFFGNPTTLNYWGVWNYGEFIGYIGIIPLLFGLVALRGKNKETIFWIVILVLAFVFALPTPLAKLPYILPLPVFSSLQPTRLMVVIDFALVTLAAIGFDSWLRKKESRLWLPLLLAAALFAALWIIVLFKGGENFQVSKRNLILPAGLFLIGSLTIILPSIVKKGRMMYLLGAILIGITTLDLLRFGWKFTPFTSKEYFFPQTAVIEFLQKQEKPFRVTSIDKRILPPNVSAYYGIETIEGYDPLISERYEELMAAIVRSKPDITPPFGFNRIITLESVDSPLLPILNVRYILMLADIDRPFLKKVFQEGETRVYEYVPVLPRAFFVRNVWQVNTKEDAIKKLFDQLFSPADTAVVEEGPGKENTLSSLTKGNARIVSYSSGNIRLETELSGEGYLVVAEGYTSEWSVRVDGISKPVYRTNYNFLGTLVPAGTHRVEFAL